MPLDRYLFGKLFVCAIIAALLVRSAPAEDAQPQGKVSDWHGYVKYDFVVDGRTCYLVQPKKVASGKPWIWRARFWGHEPQTDLSLLDKGFHLTYCDVVDLYGSPTAVKHWNAFYDHATSKLGLSKKVALEGMSRGGLIIYNWAAANPEKVACIYGDAPVCDFKSWPAAKYPNGPGKGKTSAGAWQTCLKAYGLTEEEALKFTGNPIDNLRPLADAKVPLLHVVGDADDVVPVVENTAVVEARYKELGGTIEVIHKPGVGHHPHSLKDPQPIVEFILKHTGQQAPSSDKGAATTAGELGRNITLRGKFDHCRQQFETNKQGHVAFIGGSITEMNGYRPMVCKYLQEKFPQTKFSFTDAGIASTCSTTGAFRLNRDVLSQGKVNLIFIEFAVNDDQDAVHSKQNCIRGMEGIVRQVKQHNPQADIIVTYFVNPEMLALLQKDEVPTAIAAHAQVAEHYNISTIHLAREVADQITAQKLTWKEFGGTHPAPLGNAICAKLIEAMLNAAWTQPLANNVELPTPKLPLPLDSLSYSHAKFVDPAFAKLETGWELKVPDWKSISGSKRERFTNIPMLVAEEPKSRLSLEFNGTTVGAFLVAGPDAGMVEASIDDGPFQVVNLYHHFSAGLHYPRTVIFASDLKPGKHRLVLQVSDQTKSKGTAVRIMQFCVNESE